MTTVQTSTDNILRMEARNKMAWLLDRATTEQAIAYLQEQNERLNDLKASQLLGYRDVLWERRTITEFPAVQFDFMGCSRKNSYDVQSTVAIILATLGYEVAHYCQSPATIEFLTAIGLSSALSRHMPSSMVESDALVFLSEERCYPALAKLNDARSKIDGLTVLDLLAPLLNPAAPDYQLIGVADPAHGRLLAQCLQALGRRGAVVCGANEHAVSATGPTRILHVNPQGMQYKLLQPEDLGMERVDAIITGSAAVNAALFKQMISGYKTGIRSLVAVNAIFALMQLDELDLTAAAAQVNQALDGSKVKLFFDRYCRVAQDAVQ